MACKTCKQKSKPPFTPEFEKKMSLVEKSVIYFTIIMTGMGIYGLVRLIIDIVSYIKGML